MLLFFLSCTLLSLAQKKEKFNPYICDDSSSVYSTSSKRPFRYGFAFPKSDCDYYNDLFNGDLKIRNGETVADVGGASGWLDALLSIYRDSVTFYVEDIDTNFGNTEQLAKAVAYFSNLREKPQTNQFHFVLGTEKKSNLPEATFDKIFINNSFHEFVYVEEMLTDLRSKLKPGGQLIIRDDFSNPYHTLRHSGCNIKAWTVNRTVRWLNDDGYILVAATEPEYSAMNCLTFVADSAGQHAFSFEENAAADYTDEIEELYTKSIAMDSVQTMRIGKDLKAHMTEINSVYRTVENYLYTIGDMYLEKDNVKAALNVYKIALLLYPDSEEIDGKMGDAYRKGK